MPIASSPLQTTFSLLEQLAKRRSASSEEHTVVLQKRGARSGADGYASIVHQKNVSRVGQSILFTLLLKHSWNTLFFVYLQGTLAVLIVRR